MLLPLSSWIVLIGVFARLMMLYGLFWKIVPITLIGMPFSLATTIGPIGRSPSCDWPLATLATGSMLGPPDTKVGSTPNFLKLPFSTPAKKPPYWMLLIHDSWNESGCACCAKATSRPVQATDATAPVAASEAPVLRRRRRVGSNLSVITALRFSDVTTFVSKHCTISARGGGALDGISGRKSAANWLAGSG